MNLNDLSAKVHAANINWWRDIHTGLPIQRNKGELLALIHSEISECADGEFGDLMDDKLPHRKMAEVELADAIIRALDYAGGFGLNLEDAGLKSGVYEFDSVNNLLNSAYGLCLFAVSGQEREGVGRGLLGVHSCVSRILELERKGKQSSEVAEALVVLILLVSLYAARKGYDLQGAFEEKMAYNAQRKDHQHEARKQAGGKAW